MWIFLNKYLVIQEDGLHVYNMHNTVEKHLVSAFVRSVSSRIYIHTYHSRFIPEGVAEASHNNIFSPPFYHNYLAMSNTADVTEAKPIA
jgi:hypothetical protein